MNSETEINSADRPTTSCSHRRQPRGRTWSKHAKKRCQQRGISEDRVDLVIRFGRRQFREGACIFSMDKCGRSIAARELGAEYYSVADKLNFYVVVNPYKNEIITVAHRKVRLKQ